MKEIKFCENNFSHGTEEIMNKLKEEFSDIEVSVEPCLGYCGDCAEGPFALVDDELITEGTAEELYKKIKDMR